MSTAEQERSDLEHVLDSYLPPASDMQGNPGHDTAMELARGAQLLRLRTQRLTYEQMAAEAGYADAAGARQALRRALDRHEAENAVQLRALENLGLDADERVLRTILADASQPAVARIRAVDARTRLSARRARLNGLDAPLQVQISAGVQVELDAAFTELQDALSRLTGETVQGEVTASRDEDPDG